MRFLYFTSTVNYRLCTEQKYFKSCIRVSHVIFTLIYVAGLTCVFEGHYEFTMKIGWGSRMM
jgi:hypothetical protein